MFSDGPLRGVANACLSDCVYIDGISFGVAIVDAIDIVLEPCVLLLGCLPLI